MKSNKLVVVSSLLVAGMAGCTAEGDKESNAPKLDIKPTATVEVTRAPYVPVNETPSATPIAEPVTTPEPTQEIDTTTSESITTTSAVVAEVATTQAAAMQTPSWTPIPAKAPVAEAVPALEQKIRTLSNSETPTQEAARQVFEDSANVTIAIKLDASLSEEMKRNLLDKSDELQEALQKAADSTEAKDRAESLRRAEELSADLSAMRGNL